jgi:hypothetical protein
MVVAIAEEHEEVELIADAADVADERGARGSFGLEPLHFVGDRVGLGEHDLRLTAEFVGVARPRDREPPHQEPVHLLLARRQLVLPGDVVAGARRQHFDRPVTGQPLGDVPRVQFGAAADVRAVALNNNCQLH